MTCILCKLGVPAPDRFEKKIIEIHHIREKSREFDLEELEHPSNKASLCRYHHNQFGHYPYTNLVRWAKIMIGEATQDDYPDLELDDRADAILGKCMGSFRTGTLAFGNTIPERLQLMYFGRSDIRINRFCEECCNRAQECIKATRANLLDLIQKDRK